VSRRRPRRILDHSLDDHPAVLAWRAIEPHGVAPERIEVFCDSPNWLLYALPGVGPAGSTVFAKRRLRSTTADAERAVYECILPLLPVATPRCYGCKQDGHFVWFLLQGVEGVPYDESNQEHLAMAGRWVAAMHTGTTSLVHSTALPDAGPERYLAHLVSGRDTLRRSLSTSLGLDRAGRRIIEQIVTQLDHVEACWHSIRARCHDAPTTLVHGDFRPKNVFVRHDGTGLVAFDWETAGWGPPAPDLTKIDATEYWRVVRESCGAVSLNTVIEWASLGQLFQTIAAVDWKSTELPVDTTEALATPLVSLNVLGARLITVSAVL
jgi:aminoglycoside phosphotransferase (APT) family kinase protein